MPFPEDEEQAEEWTPEQEKKRDPGVFMEKYIPLLERFVNGMERSQLPQRASLVSYASSIPAIGIGPSPDQISIRRIRNGFLMRYYEAEQPPAAPPGIYIPRMVEVFLRDFRDGADHLAAALTHSDNLARSAELVKQMEDQAARASVRIAVGPASPDEETRRLGKPPDPA